MKRFCIINLKEIAEAGMHDPAPIGCEVLLRAHAPRCFYVSRDLAERELLRLSEAYPHNDFQIFESVACVTERKTYRIGQRGQERTLYIDQIA